MFENRRSLGLASPWLEAIEVNLPYLNPQYSHIRQKACAGTVRGRCSSMKTKTAFSLIAVANFIFCSAAFAAGAKTHEVTGTVLETTPTKIVLQKGAERWEIDLDPQTKISGELKVGAKVTITYAMSATKIDAGPLTKLKAAAEEVAPITSSVPPGSQKKEVPAVSPTP